MSDAENKMSGEANQGEDSYREAYEREHLKCADLAARIADLEARCEELNWKIDRIQKNPYSVRMHRLFLLLTASFLPLSVSYGSLQQTLW